ncbi:MAG: hypothetical protein AUK47_14635 [Deltaproteobacteria bacterium CG2_30_63_29]|nr:MAG: hypothetical protein AUK47_14635 [Deltaproteobacteria bacterium CG2_30_63_29]PIW02562.1 MAG: hypothetical protein COW42_00970 [Deltaproteobacteria bacterium CG17_big_fil_post_rev_8_21_14_2_50_63_7]
MRPITLLLLLLLLFGAGFLACDGDAGFGEPCHDDRECDAMCATGGDFPGGMCTSGCDNDNHCPDDWVCVGKKGGVCAFQCGAKAACQDIFGPSWTCRDADHQGSGGKISVCLGK